MLKFAIFCVVIFVGLITLNGCAIVATPAIGIIYTDVKFGDTATTSHDTQKEGKSCATSILGWFATGDASLAAAKANGQITEVSTVDHSSKNILGLFGEFCTIVKGK